MKDRSDDPSHHERTLLPWSYISLPSGGERTINMPISTEGSGMPTTRPKTGSPVWGGGGGERTINMPTSTEGSGMTTTRPKTSSLVWGGWVDGWVGVCVGGGGCRKLLTWPYPLKAQESQSTVSGQYCLVLTGQICIN